MLVRFVSGTGHVAFELQCHFQERLKIVERRRKISYIFLFGKGQFV